MSYRLPTPDILIVGAGPTGLTLAHELLHHGIKPRLIEKTPDASPNTKALGVMARTLELLAPSGIAKEMLAQGMKVPIFSIWSQGRNPARFDTGTRQVLLIFVQKLDEERSREMQSQLSDWWDLLDVYPIRRLAPCGEDEQTLYDPDGVLAERYGITDEGLVLIRPDGYISFRSQPIAGEPLQRYFRAHFSLQYAS